MTELTAFVVANQKIISFLVIRNFEANAIHLLLKRSRSEEKKHFPKRFISLPIFSLPKTKKDE